MSEELLFWAIIALAFAIGARWFSSLILWLVFIAIVVVCGVIVVPLFLTIYCFEKLDEWMRARA